MIRKLRANRDILANCKSLKQIDAEIEKIRLMRKALGRARPFEADEHDAAALIGALRNGGAELAFRMGLISLGTCRLLERNQRRLAKG
jgi:hypothetical protein